MSALRFTDQRHWAEIESHLRKGPGERFAFAYTHCLRPGDNPILEVVGTELIPEHDTSCDRTGWTINDDALDRVHNRALASGVGLVEFHNHELGPPGFSVIDEAGLEPMARHVTAMLPDRPYGAGVYAEGRVHVEHWTPNDDGLRRGQFRTVAVVGDEFRMLNPPQFTAGDRLTRQGDVLGTHGPGTLAGLRVAIVGAGGTGSHAALTIGCLGVEDLLILDDDIVEESNLNRLVTAGYADLEAPKTLTARRRLREINPTLRIRLAPAVAPGGACLHCLQELDLVEVANWARPSTQQEADRQHGYGATEPNPAVVHVNGLAVNAAVAEYVAWIAGHRLPAQWLDVELNETDSVPGVRVTPRQTRGASSACLARHAQRPSARNSTKDGG